jgi:hypothetical protein
MAEATPQDEVLALPKLKQVLGLAEKKRLGCAFALTKDKKDVTLLIDKLAKPKKVRDQLKNDHKSLIDIGTLRFGEAYFLDGDMGTVRFDVNRSEAGGTIAHMVKLIKKAGYQGLVINPVESLENAPEDEGTAIPDAPPPPPQAPVIDAAALKARLTALVQQMAKVIAADPSRKDALMALAKEAQVMLGTNNLVLATEKTDELEAALGTSSSVPPPPPPPPVADVYGKSRKAWLDTRERVKGDLAKLRAALAEEYASDAQSAAILASYDSKVAPVLTALDEKLAAALGGVSAAAADQAKRQQFLTVSQNLIQTYKKYVESEALIGDLDENPFTPLAIRKTVGATLTALAAAVH